MHYLIIDTCVWIDLCSKKHTKLRVKIADLVDQNRVVLIAPQVVLDEWERNKPTIVEQREASIRGQIKNAITIAQYLRQDEAADFTKILDGFQQRKDGIERLIRSGIEAVNDLLKHPSTITLETADKIKLQAIDFALAKKAPFQGKNSMADALIVLSTLDYVAEHGLDNCIFVSSNTGDFGSKLDKAQIHPDLEPLFNDCGMDYYSNIGLAINQIECGLVSDESIKVVEKDLRIAAMQEAFVVSQRQIADNFRSMLDMPTIGKAFLESQIQVMESIRPMVEIPSIGQALVEIQRQMMESIRPMVEVPSVGQALVEIQRQTMESIRPMVEVPGIGQALVEIQRQMMESIKPALELPTVGEAVLESQRSTLESIASMLETPAIRSMLEVPVIGEAFLESHRQRLASIRSAMGLSHVIDSIRLSLPNLASLYREDDSDEITEGQSDTSSEQE